MAKDWSRNWKSSVQPQKQRKYRENAPYHQRQQFLTAHLADDLQDKIGTRTLPIREGDKVTVMRGDHTGETGRVDRIDREEYVVYVDGIDRETVSGSEEKVPLDPSNVKLTKLDLDDAERVAKYEVSEEERQEMQVEEAEEEAETADAEAQEEETGDVEADTADEAGADETEADAGDTADTSGEDIDYEDLSEKTIKEIQAAADDMGLDYERMLAAEEANKDRKTLIEWLEARVEEEEQDE